MSSPKSPRLGHVESFSDDSSVDSRLTDFLPVSIYGQAMGHQSPRWIRILKHARDRGGELKGEEAWRLLHGLSSPARSKVKNGIRSVRIHLVDARPYFAELQTVWQDVAGTAPDWRKIQKAARAGDKEAQYIRAISQESVAQLILLDSPVERVRREAFDDRGFSSFAGSKNQDATDVGWINADLKDLRSEGASLVRRVTEYTVKQAPLFLTASERAREAYLDELMHLRYLSPGRHSGYLLTALGERHRYDEGDEKSLRLMDHHRTEIRESIRDPMSWWAKMSIPGDGSVEPVTETTFDSSQSEHGQAADIAARFAAKFFEEGGTQRVVVEFDYVTVNGDRMSESAARDYVRRWSTQVVGII